MFEDLSPEQRRQILMSARIRHSPEFQVPRQRAIEALILNILSTSDEWFSADNVCESLNEISSLKTLQTIEIEKELEKLAEDGKVDGQGPRERRKFRLAVNASTDIKADFAEASRRLSRILTKLFGECSGSVDTQFLAPYFLAVICEVLTALGTQWASYIRGKPLKHFLNLDRLDKIVIEKLAKFEIDQKIRSDIRRRTIYFFQQGDPDFDQLKFTLGQSLYVAQLLGLGERDLLSEETFRNGKLYVDSSVVIPALLSESRHHKVFHELKKVCDRLNIKLAIMRPTVDEVRNVAAEQEKIAPALYDSVPGNLISQVKSDFFQTYVVMKQANPSVEYAALFAQFSNLAETLREMGIEVVDDKAFAKLPESKDFEHIKTIFQSSSIKIRKLPKYDNALKHDACVFKFLRTEEKFDREHLWFVTRDVSLPNSWNRLEPQGVLIRCFLLDGLLQSISPFLLTSEGVANFSEMFSQAVASQVMPHGRIFDIEDFMLFRHLEINCKEMDENTVQEGLLRVKRHVLKGASYRKKDFEAAAYEFRKYFASKKDDAKSWLRDKDKLEKALAAAERKRQEDQTGHSETLGRLQAEHETAVGLIQEDHAGEVRDLTKRIKDLEELEESRRKRKYTRLMLLKQVLAAILLFFLLRGVTKLAVAYGDGSNIFRQMASFSAYYGLSVLVWLITIKALLFRKQRLKDIFPAWAEIKEILLVRAGGPPFRTTHNSCPTLIAAHLLHRGDRVGTRQIAKRF